MRADGRAGRRFQAVKHKERARRLIRDVLHRPGLARDARFVGIEAGVHSRRCSCPMCKKGPDPRRKNEKVQDQEE